MKSVKLIPLSELKIKASSGSPAALFELGRRASQKPQLLLETLPVLLGHLPFPLPDFSTLKESQRDERIASARHTITSLAEALDSDAFHVPKVVDGVEKHWNQLRGWISFLSDTYIIAESHNSASLPLLADGDRDELHLALARLLYAFTPTRRTALLLVQKPESISIAIHLYLAGAQNPPFSLTENRTHDSILLFCSRVFNNMQRYPDLDSQGWMVRSFNMASPRLASGIIRRIIYEISKPSTEDFNSQALKQALTMLINCAMNASQFNMACIQRRSIYWVCLTMRRISGRKSRFFEADFYYIADCLKFCAMYLERTFEDFGHTAVIQALQARLISSLLRSADFILVDQRNRNQGSPSSLGAIYQSILHSIAGYAMYYSVTTVLVKSLRHIDEHHDIDSVSKSGALNPDFKMFRRAVDDRIAVGYEWNMHGMNCCVNAQCQTPAHAPAKRTRGERVPMFRCTGCNWAYYCSRDCQEHDWNNGHKVSCKKAQTRVDRNGTRLPPIIDARDIHFIGWLVQQYILEMRPTLLSQQSKYRKKSGLPKSVPLISVLDYTQFPCKVEAIGASEAIKRAPDEAWDTLLVEAQRLADKDPLVLSIIPDAGRPYTWAGFGRIVAP